MLFRYPQNDFDRADVLLGLLGSFWANTYQGNELVQDLVATAGQMAQQSHDNLLELLNSVSRESVPLYHRENWYALKFKESELNTDASLLPKHQYDNVNSYNANTQLAYGKIVSQPFFVIAKPDQLVTAKVIFNRLTAPSVELINGTDFWINSDNITFRSNPFDNPLITKTEQLNAEGQIVDREITLWLYRGEWDWEYVYEQFGYVLGLYLKSSENYKQFVNAIFDAMVEGTSVRTQQIALAAALGVPLVVEPIETVEKILVDSNWLNVITDRHAYQFPKNVNPTVAVGDVLKAGDTVTDVLQFYEFNRGFNPDSDISALAIGPELLSAGYWQALTFENKTVPLQVTTVNGYTKVTWEVSGFTYDVQQFWDQVHQKGIQANQTIAMLLDIRENPTTQPTAASLPATINPLQFLIDNLLRNNAYVLKYKSGYNLKDRLAFVPSEQLRKILPPHTVLLVIIELVYQDEPVIMEGPGSETDTGYEEGFSHFPCMVKAETLNPSTFLAEQVVAKTIGGRCI